MLIYLPYTLGVHNVHAAIDGFFLCSSTLKLRLSRVINLDRQLAKVLLIPHILICLFEILQTKDFLIHNRLDPIRINTFVHLFKLLPRAHQYAPHGAYIVQAVEKRRLLLAEPAQESDNRYRTFGFDGFQ